MNSALDNSQMSRSGCVFFVVTSIVTVNTLLPGLIQQFVSRGWQVHVVSSPGEFDFALADLGVTHHGVRMRRSISPLSDLGALWRLIRLFRVNGPALVIGSTPKAGLLSMLAARITGVPTRVLQFRGAWWDSKSGFSAQLALSADRLAARCATNLMANSRSLAKVLGNSHVSTRPIEVIGEGGFKGVDLKVFYPMQQRAPRSSPILGFVGRLNVDKGINDLLEVFLMVRELRPEIRLQIVGQVDEANPISTQLTALLGGTAGIELLGQQTPWALAELMRNWSVLVFPSSREGMPNAVLEAAACGVPTVGWDVTGVRDAVLEGVTGFSVPRGQKNVMAERILELLSMEERSVMSVRAEQRVRRIFAYPDLEERIVDHIKACLPDSR